MLSVAIVEQSAAAPDAITPWSPVLPGDGAATPGHLVDLVWDYFQWDSQNGGAEWARPASPGVLASLVHHAFQASLRSEEKRPVRVQVAFDINPTQLTVRFERPLIYDAGSLVRLSPTIGIGSRWLVTAPAPPSSSESAVGLQIVGIADPRLSPHATAEAVLNRWSMGIHIPEIQGIGLSVLGPGWLRVSTWGQRFFELRDCALRFPFALHQIEPVRAWYQDAARASGISDEVQGSALVRRMWGSVVSQVRDAHHGGCLVVVPSDRPLVSLPMRVAFPLGSEAARLSEVVRARMALEPALSRHVHGRGDIALSVLDDAHFLDRDVSRVADLVAALASVDGAVVLRRDLGVLGFGAEFVNVGAPRDDESVARAPVFASTGGGTPVAVGDATRSLASFGMRHRSAYRFCEQVDGALAFVVSQDGDLRVFANSGGRVMLYEGPTPEDWVIGG